MSERERSRSPEGNAPSGKDSESRPPADNGGGDAEGIKLYIGNLDYGT